MRHHLNLIDQNMVLDSLHAARCWPAYLEHLSENAQQKTCVRGSPKILTQLLRFELRSEDAFTQSKLADAPESVRFRFSVVLIASLQVLLAH